jgi:hypothetical protein
LGKAGRPKANAIIQFDGGEGTPLRTLVYVGARIPDGEPLSAQWWSPLLSNKRLGITVKGSMDFSEKQVADDLLAAARNAPSAVVVAPSSELYLDKSDGVKTTIKRSGIMMGYNSQPKSHSVRIYSFWN